MSFTATRPPNSLRILLTSSTVSPFAGLVRSSRQGRRAVPVFLAVGLGQVLPTSDHMPSGKPFQYQYQHNAEHNHFVAAAGTNQQAEHLQPVFQKLGRHGTAYRTPHKTCTTQHGHELRYSMPIFKPKGDGLIECWKCANNQPEMLANNAAIKKMPTSPYRIVFRLQKHFHYFSSEA